MRLINEIKPDEVYIPHPSYNQDHRVAYESTLTALRPHDLNHFVKRIFVYEQPHMLFWDDEDFQPNYFEPRYGPGIFGFVRYCLPKIWCVAL